MNGTNHQNWEFHDKRLTLVFEPLFLKKLHIFFFCTIVNFEPNLFYYESVIWILFYLQSSNGLKITKCGTIIFFPKMDGITERKKTSSRHFRSIPIRVQLLQVSFRGVFCEHCICYPLMIATCEAINTFPIVIDLFDYQTMRRCNEECEPILEGTNSDDLFSK